MSKYKVSDEARMNASLGHHLGRAIAASGKSLRDVAYRAGVSERKVNGIIAGSVSCDLPTLARICLAIDVAPDVVLVPAMRSVPLTA